MVVEVVEVGTVVVSFVVVCKVVVVPTVVFSVVEDTVTVVSVVTVVCVVTALSTVEWVFSVVKALSVDKTVGRCTVIVPVVAVGGVFTPHAVDNNNNDRLIIPAIHFFTARPPFYQNSICVIISKKAKLFNLFHQNNRFLFLPLVMTRKITVAFLSKL